ncbi:MAG TPA: tetratricopeptide repeat protein [Stellaceae bacterium]|jgi:tetratricopeptide (TPR) repeat protein|nr:tetratricopeptide repeat protein [Stellaceae bacterium]
MIEYPLVKPDELVREAWAAMTRHDSDEALRLWGALRDQSPDCVDGYIWAVQVLWLEGRFDEAEALAQTAFAHFPRHSDLLVQHAWIASARQDWDEAARRWAFVRERVPARMEGYQHGARALWQAGRTEEAETVAADGLEREPKNIELVAESAWAAAIRQDWENALARWMLVHATDPDRLDARLGSARALRMLRRLDDAEVLVAGSLVRRPDNVDLLIEHVWVAAGRRDWPTAAERYARARDAAPDPARVEQGLRWIVEQLSAPAAPHAAAADAPGVRSQPDTDSEIEEMSPSALMLSFESLGERCDFGAVQRHFGVEPLGLLRFAWAPFDPLIAALEDRFAAIGAVEDTEFGRYRDETILRMKKYGLIFHTFVEGMCDAPTEKQQAFYEQQRRRLAFLRNKLVSDLEDPQKIYVYSTEDAASDDDARRLFRALRAYGRNSLLYVRPATAKRPEGLVEALEDGLYVGNFPGLNDFVSGNNPPLELWRRLCLQTHRLARAGATDGAFLKNLI